MELPEMILRRQDVKVDRGGKDEEIFWIVLQWQREV